MKTRRLNLLLLFALLAFALPAVAQDAGQQLDPMMQEYLEKYATPGEHHKHLELLAGKWTTKARFWTTPEAPVMESTGTAEHKMILGERYLQTTYEGEFAGMPFAGTGIVAYDRYTKKYVETWIDSMGTMVMISEGACEDAGKLRTMVADFDDPMTQRRVQMRSVYRILDPDHYTLEMFGPGPDGKEFKAFELLHARSH